VREIKKWIEELYAFGPRRAGSPIGHEVEDYVEEQFKLVGLEDVGRQSIPLTYWDCTDHSLQIDGEKVSTSYIPFTEFTNQKGVSGELVYLDPKDPAIHSLDLKGKIVLVDICFPMLKGKVLKLLALDMHDPDHSIPDGPIHEATWIRLNWELYEWAHKRGAIGFIGILKDQPGGHHSYYAPYGFKEGSRILDKPIPGLWASKFDRDQLLEFAREKKTASIVLTGSANPSQSANILGQIKGESDQTIIVASHHDSPFQNAVEDSSGMAVLFSLAKKLAQAGTPKRTIQFMATTGHFYGSIGTIEYIKQNRESLDEVVAEIHIEHIALEAKEENGELVMTGETEPAAIFTPYNGDCVRMVKDFLISQDLKRTLVLGAHGPLGEFPPTDGGDFHLEGVPVFNYICNPVYLLVDDDDLSKIDWQRLVPVRDGFYQLVEELNECDPAQLRKTQYPLKRALASIMTFLAKRKNRSRFSAG
jgi:hypothetical protein